MTGPECKAAVKNERRGKGRAKSPVLLVLIAFMLLASAAAVFTSARAEEKTYPVTVLFFTPDLAAVKAEVHGRPERKALSFEPYGDLLRAEGYAEQEPIAFVTFDDVKPGYVPAALAIPSSDAAHFLSAMAEGKTFKQAYVTYCDSLSREELNRAGPAGSMDVDAQQLWMGFDLDQTDTVIVAGAFPADADATSLEVSAPAALTIGPNNMYLDRMTVEARVVNNASYPIYAAAVIQEYEENGRPGAHLSTNPQDTFGKFRLTTVADSFHNDFGMIPARGTATIGAAFQTHINLSMLTGNNVNVYNYVLNGKMAEIDGDGATAYVPVRLYNYSYIMAGEGAFPQTQCIMDRVTETWLPAAKYPIEDMKPLQMRAQPATASPGMIAIDAWGNAGRYAFEKHGSFINTQPDDIDTGYFYDSIKIKIEGQHFDRISRIIVAPRGNGAGYFNNNGIRILPDDPDWRIQDLLKTTLLFYADGYEDRWQYLNNDSTGNTVAHISSHSVRRDAPWNYVRRPLGKVEPVYDNDSRWKRRVGDSITVSINLEDLIPDYFTRPDQPAVTWFKRALRDSSNRGATDYFDIYIIGADEDDKPVDVTRWRWDNPDLITGRTPDFSLPISHLAKNGSARINPDEEVFGSTGGEDYLAIVPSTIQNGKPAAPNMVATDAATTTQMKYKALSFTGGLVQKDIQNGRSVWTVEIGKEVRINDYLRAVPSDPALEAVITVKQDLGTIDIWSENCKLTAGGKEVMGDFTCRLDDMGRTFWYTNQLFKVSYAKGEFLGETVWDHQAGQQQLLNGTRYYAEGELNETVADKVDREGDGWIDDPWSMFNGTGIRPEQLKKVKFLPASDDDYAMSFSFGSVLSGGVRGVYPYKNDIGLTMELETLGFMPDFIDRFLQLDAWDKVVEEVRYPYSGSMPEMYLGDEGVTLAVGGDFLFFEAGASAEFKINTLWEERNMFSVKADVNLFDKLKVGAELFLKEYNGDLLPDRISFGLGSEFIGFMPPAPFLEVDWIRGAVNDMAATAAHEGFHYIPPASIELAVGGSIGIPNTDLELGFGEAVLEIGLNTFRIGLYDVQLGPVTISEYIELDMHTDLSKGVEIPGTGGFRLSMPVIEVSGRGQIGLSWDRFLPKIIDAQGDFSFKFDGAAALRAFLATDLFDGHAQSTLDAVEAMRAWQSGSDRSMVELAGILKQLGFDYIQQSNNALFAALGAFSVNARVSGRIAAPENIPAVGGKSLVAGSVSLSLSGNVLTVRADGSVLNDNVRAGFTVSMDLARARSPQVTYYLGGLGDRSQQIGPVALAKLPSAAGGTDAAAGTIVLEGDDATYDGSAVTFRFDGASAKPYAYELYLIDKQTGASVFIETGTPAAGENSIILAEELAAGMPSDGYRARVVLRELDRPEDGGEQSPCALDAVTYDGGDTVRFDFTGIGGEYRYEVYLVGETGTALAASGTPANGTNTVTVPAAILAGLQSGEYRAQVAVYDADDRLAAPIAQSQSSAYTNPAAAGLTAPSIGGVRYVGNEVYEVGLESKDDRYGYEVRVTDEAGSAIVADCADRELLLGAGLSAGVRYAVSVRPYVTAGDGSLKLFGPWSAEAFFTAQAAVPAESRVTAGAFTQTDGAYYAERYFAALDENGLPVSSPQDSTQVVFESSDCASYRLAVYDQTTGETIYTEPDGTGALRYVWSVDLTKDARYSVVVDTVTAAGDSQTRTYDFIVSGEAPRFAVDMSKVVFDGENLRFDGYLEEGATILFDGYVLSGTWTYAVADPDCVHDPACPDPQACSAAAGKAARAAAGDYSGRFEGKAQAVVTRRVEDDGSGLEIGVAALYELVITAAGKEGNRTQVRIAFTAAADETPGLKQLVLDTTAKGALSVGMENVSLVAGLLVSPSYTRWEIGAGELTDLTSSDPSVVTVDPATGKLTLLGAGSATLTAKYAVPGGWLTATLSVRVVEKLSLGVSVSGYGEGHITLALPALPGFAGTITVSVGGKTVQVFDEGFDRAREWTVSDLTEDTAIVLTPDNAAYETAAVYYTVKRALSTGTEPGTGHEGNGGLGGGAIAGIVVASVLGAALLALVALYVFRKDKSQGFKTFYIALWNRVRRAGRLDAVQKADGETDKIESTVDNGPSEDDRPEGQTSDDERPEE